MILEKKVNRCFVLTYLATIFVQKCVLFFYLENGKSSLPGVSPLRWRSVLERSLCKRKDGCSNTSRDKPRSLNIQSQLPCQTLGIKCQCHVFLEMTAVNGWPVSQECGTVKNPLCSSTISVEHKCKFSTLHRHW